jgi:hypothetical protein
MVGSESPDRKTQQVVWQELFSKALDGYATEADLRSLSELLCANEAACKEYEGVVGVEALLGVALAAPQALSSAEEVASQSARFATADRAAGQAVRRDTVRKHLLVGSRKVNVDAVSMRRLLRVAAISGAALLAVLVIGGVLFRADDFRVSDKQLPYPIVEATALQPPVGGVCVLAEQADAIWRSGTIRTGAILPRGRLVLESGAAQLELFSGVQLVVEGQTAFTIESPLRVVLHQGAARALVPDAAHGFEVVTTAAAIVDLGTEFALRVTGDTTDVTVLQGEIEVVKQQQEIARVDSGRSVRLRENSVDLEELASTVSLPSPATVADAARDRRLQKFRRWQTSLVDLEADRRLVGRYSISQAGCSRNVPNQAKHAPPGSDAAVVGAECCSDRWGRHASAFDFTRSGSRLRLSLPGRLEGLTFVCWAKVNSLRNDYNALLLTDGHDASEPHWQILRDGRIFFSVKHGERHSGTKPQKVFYSPSFWREEMSGRWAMLAVTYDRGRRRVKHFVNGEVVSSEAIPDWAVPPCVQIGDASIANWAEPVYRTDEQFTSRNLSGAVDEFLIFSEPLSDGEVLALYKSGNSD